MLASTPSRTRSVVAQAGAVARWASGSGSSRSSDSSSTIMRNDEPYSTRRCITRRQRFSTTRASWAHALEKPIESSHLPDEQDPSTSSTSPTTASMPTPIPASSPSTSTTSPEPKTASGKRLSKSQKQMLENGHLLAQTIRAGTTRTTAGVGSTGQAQVGTEASGYSGAVDEDVESPTSTSPLTSTPTPRPSFLTLLNQSISPPPQPTISPNLRVLLTCRPTSSPRPHHKTYEWTYNGHFEKLNRAFLREQLVAMYNELRENELGLLSGLEGELVGGKPRPGLAVLRRDVKKKEVIERILREWGWPTMKEVRAEKKLREENRKVIERPIELSPAEHYFLRREPNFIRDLAARNMLHLTLSRAPDVGSSSSEPDSSPNSTSTSTILTIKGRGFDVEQFEAGVRRRFENLNEQMFGQDVVGAGTGAAEVGPRLDHLYETISVMSNAFVESTRGGNIKISHFKPSDRDHAIDLLRAARQHLTTTEPTSRAEIVSLRPDLVDQPHAMYPHLPPTAYVPSALSASSVVAKTEIGSDWYLAGQSWFRIRQVGGWFDDKSRRGREGGAARVEGIVTISGKGGVETIDGLKRGDPPDWVKLVTSVEYGQLVFSSGDTQNTSWTAPIAGENTLEQFNHALGENSLSTVFLPGSISPLHEVEALGRPPATSIRLRYEEETSTSDNDWKPFVEIECAVRDAEVEHGVEEETGIRGSTGREQVQYCLRPASDTDARIRRRFAKTLESEDIPSDVRQYAEAMSASAANASATKPPATIRFDGKVFTLRHAARINSYQDSDDSDVPTPVFEHSTDLFTNVRGCRIEEKVVDADLAILGQ